MLVKNISRPNQNLLQLLLLITINEFMELIGFDYLMKPIPTKGVLFDNVIYKILSIILLVLLNFVILKQSIYFKPLFQKFNLRKHLLLTAFIVFMFVFPIFGQTPHRIGEAITVGLIAAIPEEYLHRGIILGSLLKNIKMKNQNTKILVVIIINSLLFALYHLDNMKSDGFQNTLGQMIQVFGMAVLLDALYLRYGSILIPMLFHFAIDFEATLANGLQSGPSTYHVSLLTTVFNSTLVAFIYIIIAWFVLRNHLKDNPLLKKIDLD